MTFAVRTKFVSSLNEFERRFAIPVQTIGQYLARAIVTRIRLGIAPQGRWSPLGAFSTDKPGAGLFWLPPGRAHPQGPGFLFEVTSGQWEGWAAYRSYRDLAALIGHGAPRDLDRTGAFLASIMVRVLSPTKAKIAPYGSHPTSEGNARLSNTALGYLDSRRERYPLLHPSPDEVAEVARMVNEAAMRTAIEAAQIAGVGTQARRTAASFTRRASKLLGT